MANIVAENLNFSYQSQIVLENINFCIQQGEYVGILGPNGGGKTTLLKLILGLLKPTLGKIEIQNNGNKTKIGYVPQKISSINSDFPGTVWEVVATGFANYEYWYNPYTSHKTEILQALEQVSMVDFRDRRIGNLSGGEKQRVMIARSLVTKPDILILDEPTTGVDAGKQEDLYSLLAKLNEDLKLTILLVSHDIAATAREAQKILCIDQKLIIHTSSEAFLAGDYLQQLYNDSMRLISHNHSHT